MKSKWTSYVVVAVLALSLFGCEQKPPTKRELEKKRNAAAYEKQRAKERADAALYPQAKKMFEARCKKAGVFIYKKVEDVEGIFLMKVRPKEFNDWRQYELHDPYGDDLRGKAYIGSFLRGRYPKEERDNFLPGAPPRLGYHYVEAVDPEDGKRYRYTGHREEPWQYDKNYLKGYTRFVVDKQLAPGERPRYGVTYEDISTQEERKHWIAGSSLRIIDLSTDEVIAERIGYLWDAGMGSTAGFRSPWLMAADNACPGFSRNPNTRITNGSRAQLNQTTDFAELVLVPIKEDE